jgi:bifunctional DNA-binding transcriptional regulator/antitoxin component of YhaV-PrlF toxin-antitoxin module
METIKVSDQGALVIPRQFLAPLDPQPGQEFTVMADRYGVHLVPVVPIESLFGILKGCHTEFVREKEDRPL